jgi:hypothetical protein
MGGKALVCGSFATKVIVLKDSAMRTTENNPYIERTGYVSAANGETVGSVFSTEASATKNGPLGHISGWS